MQALIVVDIQNDFLPDGALAVPEGDQVVPIANRLMECFPLVVATRDFHPADHGSFAANHEGRSVGDVIDLHGIEQILWPTHCVQGTPGAEFASGLGVDRIDRVFYKGTASDIDSYSTFFDNAHRRSTGLSGYLEERGVDAVYIMGLATDYCVKFSALDAIGLGLRVVVVEDGCRGVNLQPGDVDAALQEMRDAGVEITTSAELVPA